MKIIHCLNHFLPQQVAGTEIYTRALVKELLNKQIEALVIIPNYGKTEDETYCHENIKVIQYAEPSIVDRDLIMGRKIPEGLKNFVRIIKEENPSIVHFHVVGGSNGISLHHVKAVKESGINVVMTFHLAGYTCKTGNLLYKNESPCDGFINPKKCTRCVYTVKGIGVLKKNFLYTAALATHAVKYDTTQWNNTLGTAIGFPFLIEQLKKNLVQLSAYSDKMVVLTRWYEKILIKNEVPAEKLKLIAQGLPSQRYVKAEALNYDVLKLIFVGRINQTKGVHLLIEAFKHLPSEKISLDIYGQADEPQYSADCMASSASMKNISWKGILPPETIVTTLRRYHCLCLPSVICEMSPLVIQEAFAACIPVIASDVYGNAEQIYDGDSGWLFRFNNSSDLKNKLQRLISEPKIIEIAKNRINPVKTFASVADEYEMLYKEILKA